MREPGFLYPFTYRLADVIERWVPCRCKRRRGTTIERMILCPLHKVSFRIWRFGLKRTH